MAVVLGVSSGFVVDSPIADPSGTGLAIDNNQKGTGHTTPVGATKVTEIGWWCDNATEEANYQVAIYDDDAGSPGNIVGSALTNAKGTGAGWKKVTGLNISVSAETAYWIVVALANTITTTTVDYSGVGGGLYCYDDGDSTLNDPWEGIDALNFIYATYAVWEAAAPEGNAGIMTPNTGFWGPTF